MASRKLDSSNRQSNRVLRVHLKTPLRLDALPKEEIERQRHKRNDATENSIECDQRTSTDDTETRRRTEASPANSVRTQSRRTWEIWEDRPWCSIHDAVALALDISTRRVPMMLKDPKAPNRSSIQELYKSLCLAVVSGEIDSGLRGIPPQEDYRKIGQHQVSLRSVIKFLERSRRWRDVVPKEMIALKDKFIRPDESLERRAQQGSVLGHGDAARRKAPDKFIAALIELLAEIGRRAGSAGLPFSATSMPGQKKDLFELARRYPSSQETAPLDCELSTFTTYVKGLCCFKQGAQSSDLYAGLFPELLTKANP